MGNLHGSPDNMKLNENGDLLVAFPAVRNKILTILDRTPILRKVLIYLPEKIIFFFAKTTYAAGIKIDTRSGKVKEYMFGPNDPIKFVTTIVERNGTKYFSSLI